MKDTRLFLAEDDLSLGQGLVDRLTKEGFRVTWSRTIAEAKAKLSAIETSEFELAILDLGLPDGSGFELARLIKEMNRPLVMMTALNSAENRLEAYELGSEEFIPKPFHFRELLLRIQHVLEAHPSSTPPVVIELPSGSLDLEKMCFTNTDGGITFFAPKDFRVLKMLIEQSPKPVHRDEILEQVWGMDSFPTQRTIDNSIVRIRQTISDPNGELVRSVRSIGYQWMTTKGDSHE